jgi:hypothetical protein
MQIKKLNELFIIGGLLWLIRLAKIASAVVLAWMVAL